MKKLNYKQHATAVAACIAEINAVEAIDTTPYAKKHGVKKSFVDLVLGVALANKNERKEKGFKVAVFETPERQARDAKIVKLHKSGMPPRNIAKEVGMSKPSIHRIIRKYENQNNSSH